MSAYEGGQNHLPDIPAERWREMYEEAAAELERLRADLARAEADAKQLAQFLARELFQLGSFPTPCQRIEFKGGSYPNSETSQGGFGEAPLAHFLAGRIKRFQSDAAIAAQGADHG